MHVGQRLAESLVACSITRVFGVPGGQTTPLYDGIGLLSGQMSHVLMRDERSAAFAADGYARISGTVGVCDATVGPGASNLVSGLLEAATSSVPVLAIVSDIPRRWEHRRKLGSASQGYYQREFLEPCVKHYARVEIPENIDAMLASCLRIATSGRPGPVVLEIPDDVFASEWTGPAMSFDAAASRYPRFRAAPDPASVEAADRVLSQAERPILLVGGGAHAAGAGAEIARLAETLQAPVATSVSGKGIISDHHPLSVGVAGSFGVPDVNRLLREADCVIAIGTKLGQGATLAWSAPRPETRVIHIEVDGEEIARNYPNTTALCCDAQLGTAALADALEGPRSSAWDVPAIDAAKRDWWAQATAHGDDDARPLEPRNVIACLTEVLEGHDVVVSDASLSSGWVASGIPAKTAGRGFLAPRGLAGLGWGLPAAIGAALAVADAGRADRVFCVAGDGGWGYSVADVETAARFELPLTCVVLNNSTLAWTSHSAANRYPRPPVSQNFNTVDFAACASALGAVGHQAESLSRVSEFLKKAVASQHAPFVIEALTSPKSTPVLTVEAAY